MAAFLPVGQQLRGRRAAEHPQGPGGARRRSRRARLPCKKTLASPGHGVRRKGAGTKRLPKQPFSPGVTGFSRDPRAWSRWVWPAELARAADLQGPIYRQREIQPIRARRRSRTCWSTPIALRMIPGEVDVRVQVAFHEVGFSWRRISSSFIASSSCGSLMPSSWRTCRRSRQATLARTKFGRCRRRSPSA